jgi:hypothetical protein
LKKVDLNKNEKNIKLLALKNSKAPKDYISPA